MWPLMRKVTTSQIFQKSSFSYGVKLDKICDKMIPYPAKSGEKL